MTMTLTSSQVAEQLHVSIKTVRALRRSGLLQGSKLGKGWIYTVQAVNDLLQAIQGQEISTYEDMLILADTLKSKNKKGRSK